MITALGGRSKRPRRVVRLVVTLGAALALAGCTAFRTGYELGEAEGIPPEAIGRIVFENDAKAPPGLLTMPARVVMPVFYEGGTATDRYARLVDDPTSPGNRVLHFWMRNATIPTEFQGHLKGRIQTDVDFSADTTGEATVLYARQRIYIHPDLAILADYPPDADQWWKSPNIHELKIGAPWRGHPNAAAIALRIAFDPAGVPRLVASAQRMPSFEDLWHAGDPTYELPIGEWLTMEVGYKMGDADTGRFVVTVQRESDLEPRVVIDVTDWTYDPQAPEPVPLTDWQPQKLYASDNVLHFVRDNGGVAQLYWDDFEFSGVWPAGWPG